MPVLNENHNIQGHVSAGFETVYDVFLSHFEEGSDAGAGFCVLRDGEYLIDLTGGTKDRKRKEPWTPDTLVQVYSSTKAVAALVIASIVEQGQLSYDHEIASIWPEFDTHGKGQLTVAQIMSHQSGLSGLTEPIAPSDWLDWDLICDRLANQKPIWAPGSASGYHPITFGYLAGEIARRTDKNKRTLGTILREDICAPNNIDFFIGTPESAFERCASLHRPRALSDLGDINPATKAAFLEKWSSSAGVPVDEMRKAEMPAANGHGTAKSLARLMQLAVDGNIGETRYLSENTLYEFSKQQISGQNLVLPFELTFAAGVMINRPNHFYGPNEATLGHSGWGGSCTFADPIEGISAGYVMNKQSNVLIGDPRPGRLIEALYNCL